MPWQPLKLPSSWLGIRLRQPPSLINPQAGHLKGVPILAFHSSQQALRGQSSHLCLRMISHLGILRRSLGLRLVEAIPCARGRIGPGNSPAALDAQGVKSRIHRAGGSVLLPTGGTQRQALRSGALHGMIMHWDPLTSAGLPLTLRKFQPKETTEETVGPTIASQGSEMATGIMRPTQAKETPVGGTKKEVKAGARHLKMTNPIDGMLGGSPGKITSSTGSEVASNGEERRT